MGRTSVAGMFRANVGTFGDKPMFRFQGTTVTWAQHYERACRVAHALAGEGVGVGDRVAFLDRNGLEYFDVLFGGALGGAVNVAVNWRLAPAEMAAVIDDSRAKVLVVHPEFVPCLAAMESGLPSVSARRGPRRPEDGRRCRGARRTSPAASATRTGSPDLPTTDPGYEGGPDDVSMQLYTSGTTGLPKGRDAGQPQHRRDARAGRRRGIRDHEDDGQPGGDAAVPHRGVGLGAERHVTRRDIGDPARHGSGRASAVGRAPSRSPTPSSSRRC